ncbi:MAG: pyruvate, phosphate dikinase [Candidatus Krumholzibacteria bacterium]|nr:pyruvate, phosphate dikinase [Candidatus Krumholzibacteria bacterium]MDH4336308.1 pyruvate, phosphate dikinase [Candidatus Krumholzibacteria bacterium]
MSTTVGGSREHKSTRKRRSSVARAGEAKRVYHFGDGGAESGSHAKELLGGKGANIAEMTNLGIPVPPGFTITTEVCTYFMENGGNYPPELRAEVDQHLRRVEKETGKTFGGGENPLLLSVRSGARVSMPGMMDTVLNLGLNDDTVHALARKAGNPRFALDSYRRLIQMYGDVVMGVDGAQFEHVLTESRNAHGVGDDSMLPPETLQSLIVRFKEIVRASAGRDFPQDADEQLWGAIGAVFSSWDSPRAISYRKMSGYPDHWGTAVNVQAMVFGNMGEDCATGVAFTRDPSTGERRFFGEYLVNAQGEDVVAGIRTPLPIDGASESLEARMPALYAELVEIYRRLEQHYKDMQDIEFTIETGRLWMLQTRNGKRTGRAAVKIAVDMVGEGLIDRRTAVSRVAPAQLEQLLHPAIDATSAPAPIAHGLPASPGAASGRVVFAVDRAVTMAEAGEQVILVRSETSPEDIDGMRVARAILTSTGGMTSHAAVVARGMGKCCVVGCTGLDIDHAAGTFSVNGCTVKEGDSITVEGSTGNVYLGEIPTTQAELDETFDQFMEWADAVRRLRVRANADTPDDARHARRFGAEGIGLCRTEHMFFDEARIDWVRRMIVAESEAQRRDALEHLLPMQREDFVGVFRAMDGLPVTVRLLDPPLHEFVPGERHEIEALAKRIGVDADHLATKIRSLHEFNPMLGHRGCRLGITFPEIYEMQVRAIVEAACAVQRDGVVVHPEIMIPLVGLRTELALLREMVVRVADKIIAANGVKLPYLVGTMIEVPRAALTAGEIASVSDFFSFGTNDLTQMTFGFSRDDSPKFLAAYIAAGVLTRDPFETIDMHGVGRLVRLATEEGRAARPGLKVGVCGEHGGDPASVRFMHDIGLDYVSCSPFRVPVARLAAAQAAMQAG